MHAVEPLHSPTAEEIMEYLDGEGAPDAREHIAAHVAGCATCQAVVASQRGLSDTTRAWMVAPAPASLRPPVLPTTPTRAHVSWLPWLRRPGFAVVTFGAFAAAAIAFVMIVPASRQARSVQARTESISLSGPTPEAGNPTAAQYDRLSGITAGGAAGGGGGGRPDRVPPLPDKSSAQAPGAEPVIRTATARNASVIRTATLRIVARDFANARQTVESIVAGASGFIDQMTVIGDASAARQLRGTLRVPNDRLTDVLTRLRAIGAVTEDTQGSQDVSDQLVDLDARLASARATEQRLTELLQQRTGKLSDVLDVERELARVRLDIERLDAEKTNIGRRVSYASVDITVIEERKAAIDGGPLSLTRQIRLAALDGIENLLDSGAGVLLFVLRGGPALLFWGLLAATAWLLWRRLRGSLRPATWDEQQKGA